MVNWNHFYCQYSTYSQTHRNTKVCLVPSLQWSTVYATVIHTSLTLAMIYTMTDIFQIITASKYFLFHWVVSRWPKVTSCRFIWCIYVYFFTIQKLWLVYSYYGGVNSGCKVTWGSSNNFYSSVTMHYFQPGCTFHQDPLHLGKKNKNTFIPTTHWSSYLTRNGPIITIKTTQTET